MHNNYNYNNNTDHIERRNSRFFTISSLYCEVSPARTLKWPGRNHVQITCNTSGMHHVRHVLCHMVQRDSSTITFHNAEISFNLALCYWLKPLTHEGWRKPQYPEKTPDDKLQKMPYTKVLKFKSQPRLEPALWHWWQARKADVLTATPCITPRLYRSYGSHTPHCCHTEGKHHAT